MLLQEELMLVRVQVPASLAALSKKYNQFRGNYGYTTFNRYSDGKPVLLTITHDLSRFYHYNIDAKSNTTGACPCGKQAMGEKSLRKYKYCNDSRSSRQLYCFCYTTDANCVSKDTVVVTAKSNMLIGGQLLSIYQNYDPNNSNPGTDSFFVTDNGYVTIDIFCKVDTTTVINLLSQTQYGLINRIPNGISPHTVTGDFPIVNLLKLNLLPIYLTCKPYYLPCQGDAVR